MATDIPDSPQNDEAIAREFDDYLRTIASVYAGSLEASVTELEQEYRERVRKAIAAFDEYRLSAGRIAERAAERIRDSLTSLESSLDDHRLELVKHTELATKEISHGVAALQKSLEGHRRQTAQDAEIAAKRIEEALMTINSALDEHKREAAKLHDLGTEHIATTVTSALEHHHQQMNSALEGHQRQMNSALQQQISRFDTQATDRLAVAMLRVDTGMNDSRRQIRLLWVVFAVQTLVFALLAGWLLWGRQ